jgi:hypothetical protein
MMGAALRASVDVSSTRVFTLLKTDARLTDDLIKNSLAETLPAIDKNNGVCSLAVKGPDGEVKVEQAGPEWAIQLLEAHKAMLAEKKAKAAEAEAQAEAGAAAGAAADDGSLSGTAHCTLYPMHCTNVGPSPVLHTAHYTLCTVLM